VKFTGGERLVTEIRLLQVLTKDGEPRARIGIFVSAASRQNETQ